MNTAVTQNQLTLSREVLMNALKMIIGVIEQRQVLPILSHALITANEQCLEMVATDSEVELITRIPLEIPVDNLWMFTVPGKKFSDICKALPDGSNIDISQKNQWVEVCSGRSKFTLSSLPAEQYPRVSLPVDSQSCEINESALYQLITKTYFAMAHQDVRYFLNGVLLEFRENDLRCVATDGHRLAMHTLPATALSSGLSQAIIPRKAITELMRLLTDDDSTVKLTLTASHIRIEKEAYTFTSNLIDGKYPDYEKVLPQHCDKFMIIDRAALKESLQRVSILANEKFKSIRLIPHPGSLTVTTHNPEHEAAEESIPVQYEGESVELAFNVNYLLDILNTLESDTIKLSFTDSHKSILIEDSDDADSPLYVIMPLQL